MTSRAGRVVRLLRAEGPSGLADKLARRAAARFSTGERLYLRPEHIADSAQLHEPLPGPLRAHGAPLHVGWVMTGPGRASGGHATIFRLVAALEAAGHRCTVFVHDPAGGSPERDESLIRELWPHIRAEVRSVDDGLPALDAYVATAWETAHVLAVHPEVPGRRFYLVQDYEPYFYARGAAHTLAEDSYRFGFTVLTVGHFLAEELGRRFGIAAVPLTFGCDHSVYRVLDDGPRDGVVFYSRASTPRRGHELGVMALERFAQLRPDVPIHTFGSARRMPFPAEVHPTLTPQRLNELYQRCAAGLALSFTNISLIPYELLAAGVLPVLNDWRGSRHYLDGNPYVEWARPTPDGLAAALVRACDRRAAVPAGDVSASVGSISWTAAEQTVVAAVEGICWGAPVGDQLGEVVHELR